MCTQVKLGGTANEQYQWLEKIGRTLDVQSVGSRPLEELLVPVRSVFSVEHSFLLLFQKVKLAHPEKSVSSC